MNALSLQTALPTAPVRRPAQAAPVQAAPAARLSAAERAGIADAFPAKPAVAQRLYGADRSVQPASVLGSRLDLRG